MNDILNRNDLHWLIVGVSVLVGTFVACSLVLFALRRTTANRVRRELGSDGWADRRHLRRGMSLHAARKLIRQTRPSLASASAAAVRALGWTEYAIGIGATVVGTWLPRLIYGVPEDVIAIIAPPRRGKTAWMAGKILEAPGAVLVTSTKVDIYTNTAHIRAVTASRRGRRADGEPDTTAGRRRPPDVFNPEGIGDLQSTVRWSPVAGCQDASMAIERASYMVGAVEAEGSVTNARFWESQATRIMRAYLMAAALADYNIEHVANWIAAKTNPEPLKILQHFANKDNGGVVPSTWVAALQGVYSTEAAATRDSVFHTLELAVEFLADPGVAEATRVSAQNSFDIDDFLRNRGTLYLFGKDKKNASVAPLFSAFVGWLFEEATRRAQRMPGGRLDPYLSLFLDEVAQIVPVPLNKWAAVAGGQGISLMFAVQSPSQIFDRWGERGGQTVWECSTTKIVTGGLSHPESLEMISLLCGERDEQVHSTTQSADGTGSSKTQSTRTVRVLPPAKLANLERWYAVVLHSGMPATVVRITPVWKHWLTRKFKRNTRLARLAGWFADWRDRRRATIPADDPAGV